MIIHYKKYYSVVQYYIIIIMNSFDIQCYYIKKNLNLFLQLMYLISDLKLICG